MSVLSEEIRQKIRDLYPRYPSKQAITLPALHLVQDANRCVSLEAIKEIAELLELHPSEINDTMSFYGFFRPPERPLGNHRVWVCRSISCALRGGEELLEGLCDRYHVHPGETTADGKLTIEYGECLGLCEGAPCLLIDDNCHGNLTDESAAKLLEQL